MSNIPTTGKKIRAINLAGNSVGKQRQGIYQQAHEHIVIAMDSGFYLEAITLIESLISDRLESRLTYLLGTDFSFKVLHDLIKETQKNEADEILLNLVTIDLDEWRKQRNKAIHEMVKIVEGDTSTWEYRSNKLPAIATEGHALLRKIERRVQSLRDKAQRNK